MARPISTSSRRRASPWSDPIYRPAFLIKHGAQALICDEYGGGYALWRPGDPPIDGVPLTLAADTTSVARELLRQVIADAGGHVLFEALTTNRRWAIDIACDAGLRFPGGPLFCRGAAGCQKLCRLRVPL